jgi:hypothetical protein
MKDFIKVFGIFLKLKLQEIGTGLQVFGACLLFTLVVLFSLWLVGFLSIAFISPLSVLFQDVLRKETWLGAPFVIGCVFFMVSGLIAFVVFLCYTVCTWIGSNWSRASIMAIQDDK